MANKPNVLLIVADQWRGDCLGCAGHPDVKTPFLDTLATHGTLFTRAYSAVPSCIAARAALLTGMDRAHTGRVGYQDGVRWDYANTLAGAFTKAGYQTHCAGKMHVHPLRSRQGFESVTLHDGYLHYYQNADTPHHTHQLVADDYMHWLDGRGHKNLLDGGLECNGWPCRPWQSDESEHPTRWVTDRALDFLRSRDREQPFFLTLSYVRPHPPFDPPESYLAMYRGKEMQAPPVGDWAPPLGATEHAGMHGLTDPALLSEARRGYYALMTQIDHQIGRVLETLGSENERANTVVAFVSDHGEMLGDHHLFRKALPYEGSAHVPLILSGPGVPRGKRDGRLCELMDVMPTLLAACDISVPETVDGLDALGAQTRDTLFGEHSYGDLSNHWAVTAREKYVWFSQDGREQYFDLENDSRELRDLSGDEQCAGRVAALRAALARELAGREEGYSDGERLVPGNVPQAILRGVLGGK